VRALVIAKLMRRSAATWYQLPPGAPMAGAACDSGPRTAALRAECDRSFARIVAEALCLNLPVLIQRRILGGWKYINRYTGTFFDDEHDVVAAAAELLASAVAPCEWFRGNFGPESSSRRLTALLRPLDASLGHEAGWRITAAGPQGHRAA